MQRKVLDRLLGQARRMSEERSLGLDRGELDSARGFDVVGEQ